jgi:hypothetical protein
LNVTSGGIEFYGKRYSRAPTVGIAAVAGKWESARGTAIMGGEGINISQTLTIKPDGSFHWEAGSGGVVSGEAVSNNTKNKSGRISIAGSTVTFHGDDGSAESFTFLPVPGDPVSAVAIGSDMFTRIE